MMASGDIETPTGKGANDENFPVASFLIAPALRPHVFAFYDFVRAADDIADNGSLLPDDKLARLKRFDDDLAGPWHAGLLPKAKRLRESLAQTGISPRHALDLLSAFKQDAVKNRYSDWADLIDYCLRSAAPVGRYLIDLHGESRDCYPSNDALCNALQVINHLQDCSKDFIEIDRVYLPSDWLAAEGVQVSELRLGPASAGMRRVLDRCIAATEILLRQAAALPLMMKDRRLAMETAIILRIAERLTAKLKRQDPLAMRVELSKMEYFVAVAEGLWRLFRGRW